MSGKVRWLTICTLLALLVAGWVWRYTTMNAFYASKTSSRREIYPVGEAVPFGTDVYAGKSRAEGYFLRVDSFEIVDEKNSLFNPQELDDYATLMAELKKEKEAEVLADSDLMSEAEQNTRSVLQEFLTTDDETADYTFIFK